MLELKESWCVGIIDVTWQKVTIAGLRQSHLVREPLPEDSEIPEQLLPDRLP
jgi:hypothetical protein